MGDISIMARRLADGHVQYGWSGNGGYFKNTGIRLLDWYDNPEMVEYLFSLGELALIGRPGSEHGGSAWMETHGLTGQPHSLGTTEREIFRQIPFIDYGYFYDTDHKWYYVVPGPFRIKIPLRHIYHAINKDGKLDYEFDHLKEIEHEIVCYMLGGYLSEDTEFASLLKENKINPDELLTELFEQNNPLYYLFDHYRMIFSYFDDWILAVTEDDDKKITRYILRPKTEKHIETIMWK